MRIKRNIALIVLFFAFFGVVKADTDFAQLDFTHEQNTFNILNIAPTHFSAIYQGNGLQAHSIEVKLKSTTIPEGFNIGLCESATNTYTCTHFMRFGELLTGEWGSAEGDNTFHTWDFISTYDIDNNIAGTGTGYIFLDPTKYYYITVGGSGTVVMATNASYYPYFVIDSSDLFNVTDTQIYTTTPTNKATLSATSTSYTLGYTGTLNATDLNSETRVHMSIQNSQFKILQNTCADVTCAFIGEHFNFTQDLLVAGTFDFSTTTGVLPIGTYYMDISIEKGTGCVLGICVWKKTIYTKNTSFIVGTTTKADRIYKAQQDALNGLASTTSAFLNCGIGDFNLFNCGNDLLTFEFTPPPNTVENDTKAITDELGQRAPFSYLGRLVDIFLSTSTVALPTFTAPIRIGNSTTTDTLFWTIDMNDIVEGAGVVLADTRDPYNGKNLEDIFYPIVQLIVALAVLVVIIKDVAGSHKHANEHLPKGK